jgi:hypothetical protein
MGKVAARTNANRDYRAARGGEVSAGEPIERLGIEQANASQLCRAPAKNILIGRRAGPLLPSALTVALLAFFPMSRRPCSALKR